MQSALPSISAFCKAENSIKQIDRETKHERSELFDCNKTLKDLIKQDMISNEIESIQVEIEGKPHYIRFQVPQPSRKLSNDDVMKASENLSEVFDKPGYIPDMLVKLITDRLKELQSKNTSVENRNLVMCSNKCKTETPKPLEHVPKETTKLVSDFLSVNKRLGDIRKKVREDKKEFVETKKRMNDDVIEALKNTKGMTQQVQMMDPRSGLRQSMVLKGKIEKKQQTLGIRTIVPIIREAAVRSLEKISDLTKEEFEEEFRDELLSLIVERPSKEKRVVKFTKKSGIES